MTTMTKREVYDACVLSTLLYGSGSWTKETFSLIELFS